MTVYYRPIIQNDPVKPSNSYHLGGQKQWFDKIEINERGHAPVLVSANEVPKQSLRSLTNSRQSNHFSCFIKPKIMGILNVTPDSFSDGGKYFEHSKAFFAAEAMIAGGADLIDIGGESTRPGAKAISQKEELMRIEPVLKNLKSTYPSCKISVDTRKSAVMSRAMSLGVDLINDVSAMTFDKKSIEVLAKENILVCLMHGGLNPEKMQQNIVYDNVLFDVYDYLKKSIEFAVAGGIKKENILVDPGIGFGKTNEQNTVLIQKASLFHSLGVPVLYGVSRKRFIGDIGGAQMPNERFPGSVAVALELIRQGVQFIRVHDVKETKQAFDLWSAITIG